MKRFINTLFFLLLSFRLPAQTVPDPANGMEQSLVNRVEAKEAEDVEDDSYILRMQQYALHPLDLNKATAGELEELGLLSPIQVDQLLRYRSLLGPLVSIYELQSVPGWEPDLIRRIIPYLVIRSEPNTAATVMDRVRRGEHSLLLRFGRVLERSKGYRLPDSVNHYPGGPEKYFFRYSFQYRRLLQWGILGEKDAGERFFSGKQRSGFDFYSAHLVIRDLGLLKSLLVGDYTVNLGQGLIQWQGMGFALSSDAMAIKREGEAFSAYRSAGENNFHRGFAISLRKKKWEGGAFVSYKKIDANLAYDTLKMKTFATSFQSSGYHRTESESSDKSVVRQLAAGGYLRSRFRHLTFGFQAITYRFSKDLDKGGEPYNKYGFQGNALTNFSLDYGLTRKNIHLFGELAFTDQGQWAWVNGLLASVAPTVDLALLYRRIVPGYHSFYSSAFTQSSDPGNESGIYAGITLRPAGSVRIDAYADLYRFPWLKYRVDKPSAGCEYLLQIAYKPTKQWDLYARYRARSNAQNQREAESVLAGVPPVPRKDFRLQVSYKFNAAFSIRSRIDLNGYGMKDEEAEEGFQAGVDLFYHPPLKNLQCNARVLYFDTDGYNSRSYAFENDVLYYYQVPALYGKGYRYYININYDFNKQFSAWLKLSRTHYPGKSLIGSGLDEIPGNHKTELRLQLLGRF